MIVRAFPNPSGSAIWRLADPFRHLLDKGIDARLSTEGITQEIIEEADVLVCQSTITLPGIEMLIKAQQRGKKIVADVDDWFELNPDNVHRKDHEALNVRDILESLVGVADLVTTTTPYLKGKLWDINNNVVVLPNMMDLERWDLEKLPKHSRRLRIGWAGSMTHVDDIKMIQPVLQRILDEYENVELVFVGDQRIKNLFEGNSRVEVMLGVPFDTWPTRLHGLRLDIGLAPLQDNEFNRCKSNIKWLEYSVAQVPAVLSKTVYGGWQDKIDGRKLGIIAETEEQWYLGITNLINSDILREDIGSHAHSYVTKKYDLKENINLWEDAYREILT